MKRTNKLVVFFIKKKKKMAGDKEDTTSTFLRSEVMSYVQMYIPLEVAKHIVSEIGEIGLVQFVDVGVIFIS